MKPLTKGQEVIAKYLANRDIPGRILSYEEAIEILYEDMYRKLLKVPAKMFFLGLLQTEFRIGGQLVEISLQDIKNVIIDSLEYSGYEVTAVDRDWELLEVKVEKTELYGKKRDSEGRSIYQSRWYNESHNITKGYIGQFFDPLN